MGFRVSVSLHPAIQATGRLTFAPAGLIPAEHTSLRWTHKRLQFSRIDLGVCGPHARCFKTRYDLRSRRLIFDVGRTVARPLDSLLFRQPRFRETLGNPPDVLFLLERLPGEMFAEGVFWIDLFEFFPDTASLIAVTEMTES